MTTDIATPDLTVDTSDLLKCYGLMTIGMPLMFLRIVPIALLGFVLVMCGTIWGYKMRKSEMPLIVNHSRWIKRSFWLSTLYMCFASTIFWMVFSSHANNDGMNEMIVAMQKGTATPADVQYRLQNFYDVNARLILWDWIGCFTPVVLHAVIRFIKGYRLADAGLPIPNVKTWWL